MKRIEPHAAPSYFGSGYPAPYDAPCLGRSRSCLAEAAGLSQFGVNLLRLAPGAWSSQRHWHDKEDEREGLKAAAALAYAFTLVARPSGAAPRTSAPC